MAGPWNYSWIKVQNQTSSLDILCHWLEHMRILPHSSALNLSHTLVGSCLSSNIFTVQWYIVLLSAEGVGKTQSTGSVALLPNMT